MKADLMKRLFKGVFSEDVISLKKIALTIISDERKLGHGKLADSLEHISATKKPRFDKHANSIGSRTGVTSLPTNKRDNSQLVSLIPRELLRNHMVLSPSVGKRLQSIEKEYTARERLEKYNLTPKKKILL